MLSCREISNLSSEYLDNQLPFMKRLQVKMHLFMCSKCRAFVKQMQLTIEALKQLNPSPDEAFIDQQVKVLLKENAAQLTKFNPSDKHTP